MSSKVGSGDTPPPSRKRKVKLQVPSKKCIPKWIPPEKIMWKDDESVPMEYLHAMCHEWTAKRGYEDTCWVKAIEVGPSPTNVGVKTKMPSWLGNEAFHLSHQSNLLRKNPEHYGQFFMGISKDLPYVWPTKKT